MRPRSLSRAALRPEVLSLPFRVAVLRIHGRPADVPPTALARLTASLRAPLMRSCSLQRSLAAPCRGSCRLLTIPLRRLSDRGTHASTRSPLRFSGLHVLLDCSCTVQDVVRRVIHDRVLRGHVSYPAADVYLAAWAGFLLPPTLMGFVPSQVCSGRSGGAPSLRRPPRPPAVSSCVSPRLFLSRDAADFLPASLKRLTAAPGVWPRSPAVSCVLPAPL